MERTNEDYAAFGRAMEGRKMFLDLDFDGICSAIGADAESLDEMIWNELGYRGQALVEFYRALADNP